MPFLFFSFFILYRVQKFIDGSHHSGLGWCVLFQACPQTIKMATFWTKPYTCCNKFNSRTQDGYFENKVDKLLQS